MSTIRYFSYGSNMSSQRLIDRVPSTKFMFIAKLKEHRLKFHKKSKDGSGKCDAEYTANPADCVIGVVFEILATEKPELDRKEGRGFGYEEKSVIVLTENDDQVEVVTYYATKIDALLKPYHWYKEHVLRGAKENNLPLDYISMIEKTESLPDPQPDRHEQELSIYR